MRRRILSSILVVVAATVLTLGVPLSVVSWRLVADLAHQGLLGQLERISDSLTAQVADGEDPQLNRLVFAVPADGRLVIKMPGHIDQTLGDRITGDVITEKLLMPGGGELSLSVPGDSVRSEQYQALGLVAVAVFLSVVVGAVVAIITARRLAAPTTDVARRAARLGAGDFRMSSRRYGINELDRVAEVLDSSAADIASLIRRERDLASDISHQLRTRLTGLRLRLEELATHSDPMVVDEVQAALDQTDRLVTVVDDLLANARSRRASGAADTVLASELLEVQTEWGQSFAGAGRTLEVHCPDDIRVYATAVRLREAIGILVDNALSHGAGTVRVAVRPGASMVVVEVSDEGDGVADALVGHIFDRGVSTGNSTGIGLGLARAFIEADGGRLELRRARPPIFGAFLVAAEEAADDGAELAAADDGAELAAGDVADRGAANTAVGAGTVSHDGSYDSGSDRFDGFDDFGEDAAGDAEATDRDEAADPSGAADGEDPADPADVDADVTEAARVRLPASNSSGNTNRRYDQ